MFGVLFLTVVCTGMGEIEHIDNNLHVEWMEFNLTQFMPFNVAASVKWVFFFNGIWSLYHMADAKHISYIN